MSLSRLAREFAAEISSHDWSDAPYRLDRAGHRRCVDSPGKRSAEVLDAAETGYLRTNVMWATAQVLKNADPNLDLHEYAAACGVPRSITHRTNGQHSDAIFYGLRWKDSQAEVLDTPGAPIRQVRVDCEAPNLVVFKRLLAQVDGVDPTLPAPESESVGPTMRRVTLVMRAWDDSEAAARAVEMVSKASLAVANGGSAVLIDVKTIEDAHDALL
jgi:hypothetical protein